MEIEEARDLLLTKVHATTRVETCPITEAEGRIVSEDVLSGMMVPPFPKSAMDGYAVRSEDIAGASKEHPVRLCVIGELFAGDYQRLQPLPGTAVRVMTGSYVPEGYDAVVRQEDTDYGEEQVEITVELPSGRNVCAVGEDVRKGDVLLRKGSRIRPLSLGLIASTGMENISVYAPMRVSILSTGSELVTPGEALAPGRIYNSISYMLQASIRRQGLAVVSYRNCPDEEGRIEEELTRMLAESDVILTTGGVSVGKKDLLPIILKEMKAEILFARTNIQPGTPTLAAILQDKPILCLSGNPYAALVNFEYYFWPLAAKWMHSDSFLVETGTARLVSEYSKVNRHRRFLRARAVDGEVSLPDSAQASSVISDMTECNCYIDLEAERQVSVGDTVRIRYFKR